MGFACASRARYRAKLRPVSRWVREPWTALGCSAIVPRYKATLCKLWRGIYVTSIRCGCCISPHCEKKTKRAGQWHTARHHLASNFRRAGGTPSGLSWTHAPRSREVMLNKSSHMVQSFAFFFLLLSLSVRLQIYPLFIYYLIFFLSFFFLWCC